MSTTYGRSHFYLGSPGWTQYAIGGRCLSMHRNTQRRPVHPPVSQEGFLASQNQSALSRALVCEPILFRPVDKQHAALSARVAPRSSYHSSFPFFVFPPTSPCSDSFIRNPNKFGPQFPERVSFRGLVTTSCN